jgi:hypothetical protein
MRVNLHSFIRFELKIYLTLGRFEESFVTPH